MKHPARSADCSDKGSRRDGRDFLLQPQKEAAEEPLTRKAPNTLPHCRRLCR